MIFSMFPTFCRYSPGCNKFPMLTLILPFSVLVRTVLRYSHGFHLLPVLARIQQFSGTHTDSTIFSTRPDSFSALVRIAPFAGSRPDSAMFRYTHSFYHFSILVRTVFRYSHGCHLLPVPARIPQFSHAHTDSTIFSTRPDMFKVLARIPPFAGTRPDSTFFRYSH